MAQVLCREGYKDAVAMLTHSKEVHDELETMVKKLGKVCLSLCLHFCLFLLSAVLTLYVKERVRILCSGPQDQLDIIKAKMDGQSSLIALQPSCAQTG